MSCTCVACECCSWPPVQHGLQILCLFQLNAQPHVTSIVHTTTTQLPAVCKHMYSSQVKQIISLSLLIRSCATQRTQRMLNAGCMLWPTRLHASCCQHGTCNARQHPPFTEVCEGLDMDTWNPMHTNHGRCCQCTQQSRAHLSNTARCPYSAVTKQPTAPTNCGSVLINSLQAYYEESNRRLARLQSGHQGL